MGMSLLMNIPVREGVLKYINSWAHLLSKDVAAPARGISAVPERESCPWWELTE